MNNHRDSTVALSATINGANWQSDSVFGYFVKNSANDSSYINLMITANQRGSSSIIIYLTGFTGNGSYVINPPYNSITYYTGATRFYASTGNVTISNYTDTGVALTGTFAFMVDTLFVTNGAFNVANP